ncbi:MAG: polyprenyl synthetase family protein [Bauldia sp.]|nr:polyprenyl synthetase family protein [Bauldia sp.]
MKTFAERLAATAATVEAELDFVLPLPAAESGLSVRLVEAMRYAVLGGGKRIRPFVLVETAKAFGHASPSAIRVAAALECLHCYSLVHDDLPAMDDDDLRRGRPTVHRAFDEATAILAGDALLTLAFELLAAPRTHPDAAVRVVLVSLLAVAAGDRGMIGGQMLDMDGEGRVPTPDEAERIRALKTSALFGFAAEAGAVLGGVDIAGRRVARAFGLAFGDAFQIADDLLDHAGDAVALGKAGTKDAARGKPTLIAAAGRAAAVARLDEAVTSAGDWLAGFGPEGDGLRDALRFVAERGTSSPTRDPAVTRG